MRGRVIRCLLAPDQPADSDDLLWVVQGLEVDIAAQGKTEKEAIEAFIKLIDARIALASHWKLADPFAEIPEAPPEIWQAWDDADREEQIPEAPSLPRFWALLARRLGDGGLCPRT